jgi:outer membrane lipoprotein-sorting protein
VGKKGDLLELIDRAPGNLLTLQARFSKWTHNGLARQAAEQMAQARGGSVSFMSLGEPQETSDQHLQVWLKPPSRWCIRGDGWIDISDGSRRWIGRNDSVTEIDREVSDLDATELGILIRPGAHLFGALDFAEPVEDEVAGRPCWKVAAAYSSTAHRRPMLLGMRLGGIDHTLWFDAVTGMILRHVGQLDDERCSVSEFSDVAINQPIPEEVFTFFPSPDTTVLRRIDQLVSMAE